MLCDSHTLVLTHARTLTFTTLLYCLSPLTTGAQRELNANRKSVLGKLSTSSASGSPASSPRAVPVHLQKPDVELQTKSVSPLHHHASPTVVHVNPLHSANRAAKATSISRSDDNGNNHEAVDGSAGTSGSVDAQSAVANDTSMHGVDV